MLQDILCLLGLARSAYWHSLLFVNLALRMIRSGLLALELRFLEAHVQKRYGYYKQQARKARVFRVFAQLRSQEGSSVDGPPSAGRALQASKIERKS